MFATIAGRYPSIEGPAEAALDATLGDQLEAGLGMVGDGVIRVLGHDRDVTGAVVAWQAAAARTRALAGKLGVPAPPLKACLLGPLSSPGPADAVLDRVARAVQALLDAGAAVVQVDEPWLVEPEAATGAGRARARESWSALLDGTAGHVTLAVPGGGASAIGVEALAAAPFASYLLDLVTGPDDWRVAARLPGDRGLILGVTNLRTAGVDTLEVLVWAARYGASTRGRGPDRIGLAPSAGLELVSREAAQARLARLAEAARVATLPGDELAATLDPRAIDARSAALGRWEPRRRPGAAPRRD